MLDAKVAAGSGLFLQNAGKPRFGNSVKVFNLFQNCKCLIGRFRMDANPGRTSRQGLNQVHLCGRRQNHRRQPGCCRRCNLCRGSGSVTDGDLMAGKIEDIEFDPPNLVEMYYTSISLLKQPPMTRFRST